MIFWLFSGCDQNSGWAIRSSVWVSFCFCAEASKIPPQGQSLFAEGQIFAV
jgi:hypothetical protein